MSQRALLPFVAGALLLAAGVVHLCTGPYAVAPAGVLDALVDPDSPDRFLVMVLGLPRIVVGALAGMALGASGTVFQAISRNPLASPDVLGFGAGAATGAIVALLLLGGTKATATGAAVAGGLISAALVYALAGGLQASPRRLIVTGIVVSAGISAFNSYLLMTTDVQDVQLVLSWLSGSLNTTSWDNAPLLAVALAGVLTLARLLHREYGLLEFSDDVVTALGVRPGGLRVVWMVIGVILVAVATAATGPIAFVALAAPHITRRLGDRPLTGLLTPGLIGACLVAWCDVVAANVLSVHPPVGIVTGALGGAYLLTLLIGTRPRTISVRT